MQTQEEPTQETSGTPPPSVGQAWRNLATPWWKAALAVLPTYLITRLLFVLLTYFGGVLFVLYPKNYSLVPLSFRNVLYNWYQWDAKRFITIATQGYTTPETAAFFPLYPALEHAFSVIFHQDTLVSGMLISNLAFLGTLIVLYRLVVTEFDAMTAKRTVLYLSIFPTALFFFAGYNESLFLFFMLLSFYTLRRKQWWLAGLFGALATLTRSIGLLMVVIFAYEFLRQEYASLHQAWLEKQKIQVLRQLSGLLAGILIPLALGIYAYGLYKHFGDPLAFSHAQANWREHINFPWYAPLLGLTIFFKEPLFTFTSAHLLIDGTAFVLFLVLLVLCFFGPERLARDQWAFAFFGVLALLLAVLLPGAPRAPGIPYDPLPSMQRFVLEIFVGFIMLARLGRRSWFHQGYLLFSLPLLAFLTFQFMQGYWTV